VLVPDVLRPGLRVVFCGTALGKKSAEVKAYYAGPGNAFWKTLHEIGLTPRVLRPQEYPSVLDYDIGLTDLCKTRSGSDLQVGQDDFDVPRLVAALERYEPDWIAFTGKNSAQAALGEPANYGPAEQRLGGSRVFVLPSPSGAARRYWDLRRWRQLASYLRSE
jgi:double-stranded uracil-DNA glycosylase